MLPGGFHRIRTACQPGAPRQSREGTRSAARRTRGQPVITRNRRCNPARLHLPALRRTDDRHRHPRAQRSDPCTTNASGAAMSIAVRRSASRTSALRQRGRRAHVCACGFPKRLASLHHHRDCTAVRLRHSRFYARTCLLGDLELHRPLRLLLHDGCSRSHARAVANVRDSQPCEIACPKLTVDRQIEHCQVPRASR